MSEISGSPASFFTAARISSPSLSPGPRKESIDERLALSNDDLNTRLIFSSSRSFRSVRAILNACSRDSMTHGPAMNSGGLSPPKARASVIRISLVIADRLPAIRSARGAHSGPDERPTDVDRDGGDRKPHRLRDQERVRDSAAEQQRADYVSSHPG